ncbi:MAG: lipopolysaccharide biosynthesis protein [Planctomycetota bacterium]
MNIKEKVLSALRWTVAARVTAQAVTWGITLVVIRLLAPADYGLMAMSEVFFGLLLMLSDAGLGQALVQAKKVSERQTRQLFGVLVLMSVALFAVLFLAAPAIGAYYGKPKVTDISRWLSLGFLLVPFLTIPTALLEREIDFKRKSLVELATAVLSALVILVLAYLGYGIWALVVGRLLNLGLMAIGLNLIRPYFKLPLFSFGAARGLIKFGGLYTGTSILWFIYSQADIFIAGRVLSEEQMGYYAVAMYLSAIASVKVMPLLNQVALPAYSRLQDDPSAVGYYFLKVVRVVALITFPIFFGLAVVAPEFVHLILGEKYEGAILPIVLLSLAMPMRMISNLFPAMVYGRGHPGVEMGNTLFGLFVMPIAVLIGVHWGLLGLCLAWLTGFPLVFAFQLRRSAAVAQVPPMEVLRATVPALVASLLMTGIVLAIKYLPLAAIGHAVEFALLVLAGIAAYLAVLRVSFRDRIREVVSTVRSG